MFFLRSRLIPSLPSWALALAPLLWSASAQVVAQTAGQPVRIRIVDSQTGLAIQPTTVETCAGTTIRRWSGEMGSARLALDADLNVVTITAAGYAPLDGVVNTAGADRFDLVFQLDPLRTPEVLQPERIAGLHREDETIFLGYVADDATGQALPNVTVRAEPSGRTTTTDASGYFEIYVPVQTSDEAATAPAALAFEASGYRTVERRYLELFSRGDWIYQIALPRGGGRKIVDERMLRRRTEYPVRGHQRAAGGEPAKRQQAERDKESVPEIRGPTPQFASTTEHIRIPSTIRVLRQDGTTVDYISLQTYCHRSLPSEWIASWGNIAGGTNSLMAGAVVVRTFAVGYVNNPLGTNYDICGTSTCQAYNHNLNNSLTTAACNQTVNYIMFRKGDATTAFKLTEYSAENNQLGMPCGDGFTAPSGGCLYDPVCTGEMEFGHGRGLCQWGTARWSTGRKMANRTTSDATPNGYPLQDWIWILEHYYPYLVLAQGAPLAIGDDVRVVGVGSLAVRQCAGNTIINGTACPQITTKASGTVGTIIGGPIQVTSDGSGYTWWQVNWGDTNGWSIENRLERVSATPAAPTLLTANAVSSFQINLSWQDNAANEIGTVIERAFSGAGPWLSNQTVRAGVVTAIDTNLTPGVTHHYRAYTFNQTANSLYSNITNATTPGLPPMLAPIGDRTVDELQLLSFTNTAQAATSGSLFADFEGFSSGLEVMFQEPRFSGSTSGDLDASPNVSLTTASFPPGNASARALHVSFSIANGVADPWVRLTTFNVSTLGNPVIDFTKRLRFKIWTDRSLRVGVGCRETTVAVGTPVGTDGGTSGGIEWVGITSSIGGQPQPTRTVNSGVWTELEFDLPNEPVINFASGNGTLSTASGLGTLEHLALVPAAGVGAYNIYLDDFEILTPDALTFSLDPGAPTNATINPASGVFTWTPTEAQGPGVFPITVRVTDNSTAQSDAETFDVTVNEVNLPPDLSPIPGRVVHAGSLIAFTAVATDADLPTNAISYSLDPTPPPGASVNSVSGDFTWQTADADAGSTNAISLRATDNGPEMLSDVEPFTITVLPRPLIQQISLENTNVVISWTAIPGGTYRLQCNTNISLAEWTDVLPDVIAAGDTAMKTDPIGQTEKYYRVQVVAP